MSSDEEELAELRAARAASGAPVRVSLSSLRQRQQQDEGRNQHRPPSPDAQGRQAAGSQHNDGDTDDEEAPVVVGEFIEEEVERMDDPLRSKFPLSFGEQERKVALPTEVHSKTARKGALFGPPRPPKKSSSSYGPPRPPQRQPAEAGRSSNGADDEELVGPPRPPAVADDGDGVVGPLRPPAGEDEGLVGPPRPPLDDGGGGEDGTEAGPPWPPADDEGVQVGPPRPPADDEDAEEEGEEEAAEEEEAEDPYNLPITHEVSLVGHTRAVVALALDPSGSRLVSGGMDYMCRMYDFNGMKSDCRPFRELEPSEGSHPVVALSWSCTGDAFLAVTASPQPRIYDRDGRLRGEFARGDMYIRDQRNTKGHVSGCCDGAFHPTDRHTAMTCSDDGTVRVWDAENCKQKTVVKPTLERPGRVPVTCCAYSRDGRLMGAGLMDGTIQLWSLGGKFGTSAAVGQVLPPSAQMLEKQTWTYVSRAQQLVRGAHAKDTGITCLTFANDGNTLLSRALDDTLKVWDLRSLKKPVTTFDSLPTSYPTTRCIFSPDESLIVTGAAAGRDDEGGALVFFEKSSLKMLRKVGMPGSISAVAWHPRLNQIFAGTGDRKVGSTRCLYDPTFSERGVMLAVSRAPRRASPFDFQPPLLVKTPHALPMFRQDVSRKRQREKMREDPKASKRPDLGMAAGVGRQGRIGTTSGTLLTQHLLKQKGKLVGAEAEMDPREAILRHADKADAFSRFTAAYSKTQPKPIFAEPEPEEEGEEEGA